MQSMSITDALQIAQQHLQKKEYDKTIDICKQILSAVSDNVQALQLCAIAYLAKNKLSESIELFQKCLKQDENNPGLFSYLGAAYLQQKNYDKARQALHKALEINPLFVQAMNNLCVLEMEQGNYPESLRLCNTILKIQPDYTAANINAALSLMKEQNYKDAIAYLEKGLQLEPASYKANSLMAECEFIQKNYQEGTGFLKKNTQRNTNPQDISTFIMMQLYRADMDVKNLHKLIIKYAKPIDNLGKVARCKYKHQNKAPERLGFMSGDLRKHPVGFFTYGLLKRLKESGYRLYAYVFHNSDDELSEKFKMLFESWTNIRSMDDSDAAKLIHADNLDVLFDLAGHSHPNRLPVLSRRPAPVQISWLGYPCTTGLRCLDYVIGDPCLVKENEEKLYTEKVLYLPDSNICYVPDVKSQQIPLQNKQKTELITYGSFNSYHKMNSEVLRVWAEILSKTDNSELILKTKNFDSEDCREIVLDIFKVYDIEKNRIRLYGHLPYEEHYQLYNEIDLALDTFPYNGTTTTCDALYMGVPTLSLKGHGYMISHYGEAILKVTGMEEYLADSSDDYIARAVEFTRSGKRGVDNKQKVRDSLLASDLCAIDKFSDDFSQLIRSIGKY